MRKGGGLFWPEYLPSGLWVAVDGYQGCSGYEDLFAHCSAHIDDHDRAMGPAKGFWLLPAEEVVIQLNSGEQYDVYAAVVFEPRVPIFSRALARKV